MARSLPFNPEDLIDITPAPWWADFALVVVAFLVFYALAALLRRKYRRHLALAVAGSRSADAFASLSLRQFEIVVGDAFRAQGYEVRELHGARASGGVDMELHRDGELFLVECGHWQAYKVPVTVVRELYSAVESRGAAGAFVATSGTFTEDAQAFVQGTGIRLVDGRALFELVSRDLVPAAA